MSIPSEVKLLGRAAPTALAGQLLLAAAAVLRVRQGRSLPDALLQVSRGLDGGPRGAVQDLAYRCLRQRGAAEALLALLAHKPPTPVLRELLVVALALAIEPDRPYPDHVLVDQAVAAARARDDLQSGSGFVNALMRRALTERDAGLPALRGDEVARFNHPAWWIERVRLDHPERWQSILDASSTRPVMTLRVNRRRASLDELIERFCAAGVLARRLEGFDDAVVLDRARPVHLLPGFDEGWWSVQDAGAQLAAPLLGARDGERVLDACAAPGGKTAHLLELADLDLLTIDRDADRLRRVNETLDRLGLAAQVLAADAATPAGWWDGRPFDRILADLPCTASGIVRRHPDVRWLRREADIAQLATASASILDALWPLLRPGGTMLIATCSLFRQEGPGQLTSFLDRHADARCPDADNDSNRAASLVHDGWVLPVSSDALDHDGFYYARITKSLS
ncbi:16S rRNA (cytosine(967)-C(5))-methyltransferase RsmB [soil metagenome]